MITYKKIRQLLDNAQTKQEQNFYKKQRSILHIATRGGDKRGCSEINFEKAKQCYNLYKRLDKAREKALEYDSYFNTQAKAKKYDLLCDVLADKLNKKLKYFNLVVVWCSYAHIGKKENTSYWIM